MASDTHQEFVESEREVTIPVSVVLERIIDTSKKWVLPQWSGYAVVTGKHIQHHQQCVLIHDDGMTCRYIWGGLIVHLYKDGGEGYWYNLLSDKPHLFVICEGDQGQMDVEPAFITANQDEATGYMEADRLVLSVPMPEDICLILENYVVSHYLPREKKKRKRREWLTDSEYAKRSSQAH
jgi:hypothetical protein